MKTSATVTATCKHCGRELTAQSITSSDGNYVRRALKVLRRAIATAFPKAKIEATIS